MAREPQICLAGRIRAVAWWPLIHHPRGLPVILAEFIRVHCPRGGRDLRRLIRDRAGLQLPTSLIWKWCRRDRPRALTYDYAQLLVRVTDGVCTLPELQDIDVITAAWPRAMSTPAPTPARARRATPTPTVPTPTAPTRTAEVMARVDAARAELDAVRQLLAAGDQ